MDIPLLFTFRQIVLGPGFLAAVRMSGRALLEEHEGETWITGVAPVGLAGGGMDRAVAVADFRQGWAGTLFDIAGDTRSFEEFQREVAAYLASTSRDLTLRWNAALTHVRRTGCSDSSLPSEPAEGHAVEFEIVELTHFGADANELEPGLKAAA